MQEARQHPRVKKFGAARRYVRFHVGLAAVTFPDGTVVLDELLFMYYDEEKGSIRFRRRDGKPPSEATDIDLTPRELL